MPRRKKPPAVPDEIKEALMRRRVSADSERLLQDMIDVWGGTKRFVKDVYQEFQSAPRGGMARQRILEMIQRLIVVNTTHDLNRQLQPADLTDEDLERVLSGYLERLNGRSRIRTQESEVEAEGEESSPSA